MCIAAGNTSLDDCPMLTSSFGWTRRLAPRSPPRSSEARLASTSLTFMLLCVPEPVCHTTNGNSPSCLAASTSSAARRMASALRSSSRPSALLALAAAFFTSVSAWITASGMRSPEMRKKRRLRSVCAPQSRSASTSIGPKLSFSMRVPDMPALCYGSRRRLFLLRLRRHLGMYLRHVERLRLSDHLLERGAGERPGLLEQDHLLAEHQERRNRADTEGAGELLLLIGVHFGEDDVRMRLRRLLVDGCEAFARPAPRRPEVDQHHRVAIDRLLEVFLG